MSDWKIINGDLPFKDDFTQRATGFDDYPLNLWNKIVDELPYKIVFPPRYSINDAPSSMWKINDDLPFKATFAPRYIIDDAPMALWKKYPNELPFKIVFPPMPPPPKLRKPSNEPEIEVVGIVSPLLEYIIKNKGIYIQPDTESLSTELEDLIQEKHDQGLDNVTMEELGDEYNSYINGNVDYNLRPFMKGSKVIPYGWEVDPDAIVSTIDMDYFIYDENDDIVYTVKLTPLLEDGTILTPEQLGNYASILQDIVTTDGGDSTNILGYDAEHKKIIINIEDGESQYDSEGMTTLDHELDVVKQKHVILKRIEMIQNEISTMEATSRYLTYEIILEGES